MRFLLPLLLIVEFMLQYCDIKPLSVTLLRQVNNLLYTEMRLKRTENNLQRYKQ